MTALKPMDDALIEALVDNVSPESVWLPSTEERIDETGEHPVASDRRNRGRHAAPWTADAVLRDALDGLDRVETARPRHRDPALLGGAIPLLPAEIVLAQWTVSELCK